MNARILAMSLAIAATAGTLVQGQQFTWPISVVVERYSDLAPNLYNVWVSTSPIYVDGGSAVAPDGTVFQNDPINGAPTITGLTSADLTNRFAGVWTLNDRQDVPPSEQPQQHQFTVTSSALTNGFPSTPSVISPLQGAIVPRTFEVVVPANAGVQIFGGTAKFDAISPGHVEVALNFPPGVDDLAIGVRSFATSLTDLPLATSLSPNPVRRYDPSVSHRSMSLETSITVLNVPEPCAGVLAVAATLVLGTVSRRLRPKAMPAT